MKAPARFHKPLTVEHIGEGQWRLTQYLAFYSAKFDRMLIVKEGFVTDFASVPRVPGAYLLFAGIGESAAVVHDALYTSGEVSRKAADEIYLEALEASGVSAWRRLPMFWAVRAFGASRYAASQPGLKQNSVSDLESDALLK